MATFVIVHGGWGGGWEWTPVAGLLRQRGHEVFTPTLTGLGERSHIGTDIGLSDHIEDILALFQFEMLSDVILCGHSYSGMVITGVADRIPEKVKLLTYIDAFFPRDGDRLIDLVPPEVAETLMRSAKELDGKMIPYPSVVYPPEGVIPESVRENYIKRMRPQPLNTNTEPIHLSGDVDRVQHGFVHCTQSEAGFLIPFARKAKSEGWLYREIATEHDLHLLDPEGTAGVLSEMADTD
ncbi:alpha/beta hydrolase [Chitinispirillales bacterium ANBcel5]|uniref:alpha/beta fold hydrolase n=1 Tax=Cellulosispirillum alkaliphilum TaxID=3039283 RepID=UPI002A52B45D|nr:alpha/beta hydrolase [Chitinispirillales bacterium ANBcel5]